MSNTEYIRTPAAEIDNRIQNLKYYLDKASMDGALILQRADLFYFTGTVQDAHLYVPLDGEPILAVYKDFNRAAHESSINKIIPLQNIKQLPKLLSENGHSLTGTIGMELDVLPVNHYFKYRKILNGIKLSDISDVVRSVRSIKSEYEIGVMQKAAALSDQLLQYMKSTLKEGLTELELAGVVEAEARKLGHQGIVRMRSWGNEMFYGHLAAGPSAAEPSFLSSPTGCQGANPSIAQGASMRIIGKNEPVLFDYVFVCDGYLMDQTRIFAIGRLPDELMQGHQAMLDIQRRIMDASRPGVQTGDLYDMAVCMAAEMGYSEHFMGAGCRKIRFVGHGVGIELDEYPFIAKGQKMKLEEGMVFALEPKLIYPGVGVVGIENMYLVTATGLKQFGAFEEGIIFV